MKIALFAIVAVLLFTSNAYAEVRILAASSMTNVLQHMKQDFQKQTGIDVKTVFGSSSSLARQITQGAPADLYLSANIRWAEYVLAERSLPPSRMKTLARNQLVLISPAKRDVSSFDLKDPNWWSTQLDGERLAMGIPTSVPAGIYAKQALESLGVWDSVKRHMAQTNNVRVALALAERGEVPLSIVYRTDILSSDNVTALTSFNDKWHDPIVYPLVNLSMSSEAIAFSRYLHSDQGKAILNQYGFVTEN
ncbi:molybdate ABC transporter substrate-binding protein [Vibrio penaeicida]|uniref:molybdate ABC transporter substrate-binding protein n=1 Tax=Vibrio penaeicida TaxID=104609 RepID=UPI000CEA5EEA|nr:molybdate ABC transporter substrate-binding protein [Vibrio penaeicida]